MSDIDSLILSQKAEIEAAQKRLAILLRMKEELQNSKWVTAKSAADKLGISVRTIPVWCADGRLEGMTRGRRWYVSQASIDKFMGGF